jgi:MFS transporter, SP family, sugar:H+ symporter
MADEKHNTTITAPATSTAESPGSGPGNVTHKDRIHAKVHSVRYVFRKMTWPLFSAWMISALVNIIFGYETTSFGGVQSIPAFIKEFGEETAPGKYTLSPARASYTSSTAFAGKLIGALIAPFLIERWGHRVGFWILVVVVWIGIIIEASAKEIAQFIVGRIIIYFRFVVLERVYLG